jgi:phosphatidylserine/phosphatidylglycerophosphate/cardiolipin synthase-like enzyme
VNIRPNLHIGLTPLRPEKFGSENLSELTDAVANSAVRKDRKQALEVLESWSETGELSPADFTTLSGFSAASMERYRELKDRWWDLFKNDQTGAPMRDVEARMAREGGLLFRHEKLVTELREASALAATQAMAPALPGAAGVVAAFAAYTNGPTWTSGTVRRTGELLGAVESLQSGKSSMVTEGNEIQQVHRAELWKAMNTTLDTAIANGKAGQPAQLDLQYYELTSPEIIGKVVQAAKAGNPVRVNLDAGRLSFPSKDNDGDNYFSLDATPDKIRTILQLASIPDADVAVSLFPQKKLLNNATNLMHRKVLRYGDQVLISGMNANIGSGENVDAGFLVKGPAARKIAENFARDLQDSKGATLDDIWGADHIAKFEETNLRMGKRGFVALFDSLAGPSPAGTVLPSPHTLEELEALAAAAGANLKELVKVPAGSYEKVMTRVAERKAEVQLSKKGKKLMQQLIEKAIQATTTPENMKRLDRIELPSGDVVGKTRVDIADQPLEREALVVQAIAQAEEFVYLPGFVVTKAIAAALVARRDQLQAAGKELDVRVVADSGLYPHGGTPNSHGIKYLEDNGIRPRWSKLERSGWHDRKIHAKQLLTDKGEIAGSTNFSNQAFQDNWETSAYVHFDREDQQGMAALEQSRAHFEELWETSYELDSRDHAAYMNRDRKVSNEYTIQEDRERSIRHVLRLLINYEKESANLISSLVEENAEVKARRDALAKEGYAAGDATLMAVREHLGDKAYRAQLDALPAAKNLSNLQREVAEWKAEQTPTTVEEPTAPTPEAPVKKSPKKPARPLVAKVLSLSQDSDQEQLSTLDTVA